MLAVGKGKENINKVTPTTSLWDPHCVEKFNKITMKKILENGWDTEVNHCTSHIRRKI